MSREDNKGYTRTKEIMAHIVERRLNSDLYCVDRESGKVKDNVLIVDTLNILEELGEYEVCCECEGIYNAYVDYIMDSKSVFNLNTYVYNGCISNDICVTIVESVKGTFYMAVEAHIGGDIRGNYCEPIIYEIDYIDLIFSLESIDTCKVVKENGAYYYFNVNAFRDVITVDVEEEGKVTSTFTICERDIPQSGIIEFLERVKKEKYHD